MDDLRATIRGDIKQCIFSLCIFVLVVVCFVFVRNMMTFFVVLLGLLGVMAILSVMLSLLELKRAKNALARVETSLGAPEQSISVQVQKVMLLSRPAPKHEEYLICALMVGPENEIYIYPFPKGIDGTAPIRKDIRKKLTAQPLTMTCLGDTGVISSIEGFSLDAYPTTAYRPALRRKG